MALITCKNCGKQISNKAEHCIHCGYLILKSEEVQEVKIENIQEKNEEIKNLETQLEYEKKKSIAEKEIAEIQNKSLQEQLKNIDIQNKNLKEELDNEKNKVFEKTQTLKEENISLRRELEVEKAKSSKLQEKIDDKKEEKINNGIKAAKKLVSKIINFVRYSIGLFLLIGTVVCLFDDSPILSIGFLVWGISLLPCTYNVIFNNIKVSPKTKIIIQIICPLISLFVGGYFMSKGSK